MSNTKDETNKDKYKDTVFLPKTDFPMRGGLPQKEPEILKKWDDMDLYAKLREASKDKEKWILHDGPPYANGNIHMGHALNKILKDVVIKSYGMLGYNTPYVPGWDCHGLPIEWKIEEKYREAGKDKDEVEPLQFREECRNFAAEWVDIQAEQFKRLGVIGDWENPYLTMTKRAEGKIAREIHKFVKNEGLYRGAKPVMWSVVEKTALAEAEVEYKEKKSVTVWIGFPVTKSPIKELEGASIAAWTTTPWSIPSTLHIAYGENIEYGVYEITDHETRNGEKVVVATNRAEAFKEDTKIESWTQLKTFKGSEIEGTYCNHPFNGQGYDFEMKLLRADHASDEAGTGFVTTAPSHGEDDFFVYIEHFGAKGIPDNVGDDGVFNDHVPLFAGLEVYTQEGEMGPGNFAVVKALKESGNLFAKGSIRHEYPHSWRSKAPLIFRTTPQWFISMETNDLRKNALKAISETRWVPQKGEARINAMIANRPDWCISRQRAWGVPIALFVGKESGEILKDENVLNRIGDIFEEEGSDAWWSRPASYFLGNDYNADDFEQIFDIVDVWFESGSTHAFVLEDREDLQSPADLYLEGSDQHRGWFHSSLLESVGTRGRAPYKSVLTHGFVLDEKGYKMSKSLGNVVDPLKMMEQYGADILRLWALTCDYSEDIRIGKDTLKSTGDIYRRIRNTLRFLLGALDGFTKDEMPEDFFADPSSAPELEQLVLHQMYEVDKQAREYIKNFEFMKLTKLLHDFCNENLSAFYFDIRKDRLYCDDPNSIERKMTRATMAMIFNGLTAWLAPILSFTAEEAWGYRPDNIFEDAQSVHLREFPTVPESWHNPALAGKWFALRDLRAQVLAAIEPLRADKTLGSSLAAKAVVTLDQDMQKAAENEDLASLFITSQVEVKNGNETKVEIVKADGDKCERCWKVLPEVSENGDVCNRCAAVAQQKKAA